MKKIILLFEGRTGSSMFGSLMNQHPEICFLGEELADLKEQGWHAQQVWMDNYFNLNSGFMDTRRNKENLKVLGFKIKLRDISDPSKFSEYIRTNSILIIHMHRKNFIKQVLSSIRAMDLERKHSVYNLDLSQADKVPGKYRIQQRRFNNILLWLFECECRLREFISSLGNCVFFWISYEELVSDIQGTTADFFRNVGLTPVEVNPVTLKITSDNMKDVIENYDEIKHFYSDSILAKDFDQV